MIRSRQLLYLTFSGLAGLVLTLTVTTCGGGGSWQPASPTPALDSQVVLNPFYEMIDGPVAGDGTCLFYSATPTSFDFGPSADTGEIPVTVTGAATDGGPCMWSAEAHPNDWLDPESAMTENGLIDANNGTLVVTGSGTIKITVPNEAYFKFSNGTIPVPSGGVSCLAFDATDFTMNPTNASFGNSGGVGPAITMEVSPPKTREASIVIITGYEGVHIPLFEIPVTQTGSVCGWYLKASPNDGTWILVDSSEVPTFGDGTGSFSVTNGNVPAGDPAPRNGYIGAYAEVDDQIVDTMLITQARDQ